MMITQPQEVRYYTTRNQNSPFKKWYYDLKDERARVLIRTRIKRLSLGNMGQYRRLVKDLVELKLHFGPGYRVYVGQTDKAVLVILCGGSKRTQKRDIQKAQIFWDDFKRRVN